MSCVYLDFSLTYYFCVTSKQVLVVTTIVWQKGITMEKREIYGKIVSVDDRAYEDISDAVLYASIEVFEFFKHEVQREDEYSEDSNMVFMDAVHRFYFSFFKDAGDNGFRNPVILRDIEFRRGLSWEEFWQRVGADEIEKKFDQTAKNLDDLVEEEGLRIGEQLCLQVSGSSLDILIKKGYYDILINVSEDLYSYNLTITISDI